MTDTKKIILSVLMVGGFFCLALGALLWSASTAPKVTKTYDKDFTIIDHPDREGPEFKRTYTAALPGQRTLEMQFYTYYRYDGVVQRRTLSAILKQSDGRFIAFEPNVVADTILDEALVPFVEELSWAAMEADRTWWESRPMTFTDVTGQKWTGELDCKEECS